MDDTIHYMGQIMQSGPYGAIGTTKTTDPAIFMGKEQSFLITEIHCLVFVKDTKVCSGKFKTNPIKYLFPFFPSYIDYMLQVAPYFFIHQEYFEHVEKHQPIYEIDSAFNFLKSKNQIEIDTYNKIITFADLKEYENEEGILNFQDKVKIEKNNYQYSQAAKQANKRQLTIRKDDAIYEKHENTKLANTLGYCLGTGNRNYAPSPKPLIYNGQEYSFQTNEKK
jgi:hypothetical protein